MPTLAMAVLLEKEPCTERAQKHHHTNGNADRRAHAAEAGLVAIAVIATTTCTLQMCGWFGRIGVTVIVWLELFGCSWRGCCCRGCY